MKVLDGAPAPRPDRPATAVVYDDPDARVVAFLLESGQVVPPHRSTSTVVVQVVRGAGVFRGEPGHVRLAAGEAAVFAPGESHSIEAGPEGVQFNAIIAPRPG